MDRLFAKAAPPRAVRYAWIRRRKQFRGATRIPCEGGLHGMSKEAAAAMAHAEEASGKAATVGEHHRETAAAFFTSITTPPPSRKAPPSGEQQHAALLFRELVTTHATRKDASMPAQPHMQRHRLSPRGGTHGSPPAVEGARLIPCLLETDATCAMEEELPPDVDDEALLLPQEAIERCPGAGARTRYATAPPKSAVPMMVQAYAALDPSVGAAQALAVLDALKRNGLATAGIRAPVIPSLNLIKEALKYIVREGRLAEAHRVVQTMQKELGVRPDCEAFEMVAACHVQRGNLGQAVKVLTAQESISPLGLQVAEAVIKAHLVEANDGAAWECFDAVRAKTIPSTVMVARMVRRCAVLNHIDKALLVYREAVTQGMVPDAVVYTSLIHAACKRRELFPYAMEIFRQMATLNMEISLAVYDALLYGCSKTANLQTAMSLWRAALVLGASSPQAKPQVSTCTNYLLALASVETTTNKISKRPFMYDISPGTIKEATRQVRAYAAENGIAMNAYMVSALLAIYSNNKFVAEAEELFWRGCASNPKLRSPFAYELMFKMYDSTTNYEGARTVYESFMREEVRVLPYEGWRALVRTAALSGKVDCALEHLVEMKAHGCEPNYADVKHLPIRCYEMDRLDLIPKIEALCTFDRPAAPLKFVPWIHRSASIASLLQGAYGKDAPALVSAVAPKKGQGPLA